MSTPEIRKLVENAPRACAHCPWRLSNAGTKHPHGFYSAKNLKRLWDGLRTGEAPGMTCHPTDPRMAEFEGYEKTAEREETRECAGAIVLVLREVMRFQAICLDDPDRKDTLAEYRRQAGRLGLKKEAMAEMVWRFIAQGSPLARALRVDVAAMNDPDVGYAALPAWDPNVLERSQRIERPARL